MTRSAIGLSTAMKRNTIVTLLSFNGGFVDTVGFLGLQGLFLAHVTGNFVTLGATMALGTHGAAAKILALPEFIAFVALARVIGSTMRARNLPAMRILLGAKVALLFVFLVLAVRLGPFPDSDSPAALMTGFAGIAAMAIQNAVQRVHLASLPTTTLMTGNTAQVTLDAIDLLQGVAGDQADVVRARLTRTLRGLAAFAAGCAAAAGLYTVVGFWCVAVPVTVGALGVIIPIED